MKFVNKKVLAVLILIIISAESYIAFARKHHSVKRYSRFYRKASVRDDPQPEPANEKKILTLNVNNPFFSLAVGIMESLGADNTGWYRCLPSDWVKEVPDDVEKSSTLDQNFGQLNGTLQSILSAVGKIVDALCTVKDWVLILFKQILFHDKDRRFFFIEGKFGRIRFRNKWKLFDWIKERIASAKDFWKEKIKNDWDALSSPVFEPIKKFLETVKDDLIAFKEKYIDTFIKGSIFEKVWNIIQCVVDGGMMALEIFNTFKSLKEKIDLIGKAISAGGITVVPVIADIILGMICNWKDFKKAIDYFFLGSGKDDKILKWFYYGKGAGGIFKATAGASTIIGDLELDVTKLAKKTRRKLKLK